MQVVEAKNNLVKVGYNPSEEILILSGFIVFKDSSQSFIGQIIHLESNANGSFAIIKLLFNFNEEGVITGYNGSIPKLDSVIELVLPQELLELLPVQEPIKIGELAQQQALLEIDKSFLENHLLVCSEKDNETKFLIENFALQLNNLGKKVVIIDLNGNIDFSQNHIVASENFKLPLNYETINFIYNNLEDASAETKATIQEIFIEVQDYVKTLPEGYIPFETFKNVVDAQYQELELVELVLLKNKLLKYFEEGIFAQNPNEFELLNLSLNIQEPTILDLSKITENIQKEIISYTYSQLNDETYVLVNINDSNSDKKLLKQIVTTKNVYSTIICPYSYKYLKELKQISKDLILFAPIQQQKDFAGYNVFLSKLNPSEFIIYGKSTHHLPLIVKLEDLSNMIGQQEITPEIQQDLLDEEIKKDVDQFYTAPKNEVQQSEEEFIPEVPEESLTEPDFIPETVEETLIEEDSIPEVAEEVLTEEDLDFIEDLGVGQTEEQQIEIEPEQEMTQELSADVESSILQEAEEEINTELEPAQESEFAIEPEIEIDEVTEAEQETEVYLEEEQHEFESEPAIEPTIQEEFSNEIIEEEQTEAIAIEEEQTESFSDVLNQQAQEEIEPPAVDILPANMSSTPIVPIYSADVEPQVQSDALEQGDTVMHPKYGKGTVEKMISYGAKTLCSINFDNLGRRLLDPTLVELKKV